MSDVGITRTLRMRWRILAIKVKNMEGSTRSFIRRRQLQVLSHLNQLDTLQRR